MKIAVVDDMQEDLQILETYLKRYIEENNAGLEVYSFRSSIEFLETYQSNYDIIFMDIEMPGENGLDTAREIRRKDNSAVILFVTNLIQYAICGYEVNAIDFMVKPVEYFDFTIKLEKAVNAARGRKKHTVLVSEGKEMRRILSEDILYVEKDKNNLVYHMISGSLRERGTIADLKRRLPEKQFSECMTGVLVNLGRVDLIYRDTITVGGEVIPVSRRMKKRFIQDYMDFSG